MFIYWTFKTIYTTAVLASTTLSGIRSNRNYSAILATPSVAEIAE
jgi:hypothetical protein